MFDAEGKLRSVGGSQIGRDLARRLLLGEGGKLWNCRDIWNAVLRKNYIAQNRRIGNDKSLLIDAVKTIRLQS